MKYKGPIIVALIFLLSAPLSDASDNPMDIMVVANKAVKTIKVDIHTLRNIFLKYQLTWRAGNNVVPVHSSNTKLREKFVAIVLNMNTLAEEKQYWKKQKISHGVSEPPSFRNNLKAVFMLKGSVSYVYRHDYLEGVAKVLMVFPAK
jgi:hypothetical protein